MTETLETLGQLRQYVNALKMQAARVAFVPTMGALHEGHLALVAEGIRRGAKVVVSIFVNPTQFGPTEDFGKYPRMPEQDIARLKAAGAHAVYLPTVDSIYPEGHATIVRVAGVTEPLEGAHRPGHFEGVATVVTKLLLQVSPDIALFGEKDYQQLQTIKRMVADLFIPVQIIGVPIVRAESGLALSSRNAYLSEAEQDIAPQLYRVMQDVAARIRDGSDIAQALAAGEEALQQAGFGDVHYLAACDAATLQPVTARKEGQALRLLAAVMLGNTRLIDNIQV